MSLFDTDKHSDDRGSPMPNHDDKLIGGAIKSHKTLSTHYTTDADTNTGRLQMQNKQILGNDGATNITLYGYNQALNKWGFFVTKPGVEVTTNTDLSQFIFNSSQDVFKVITKGTTTIPSFTVGSGGTQLGSVTVPHGLSFTPLVNAYVSGQLLNASLSVVASTYIPLPIFYAAGAVATSYYFPGSGGANYPLSILYAIDATNLYFQAVYQAGGTAQTVNAIPVTYFLIQETAT